MTQRGKVPVPERQAGGRAGRGPHGGLSECVSNLSIFLNEKDTHFMIIFPDVFISALHGLGGEC